MLTLYGAVVAREVLSCKPNILRHEEFSRFLGLHPLTKWPKVAVSKELFSKLADLYSTAHSAGHAAYYLCQACCLLGSVSEDDQQEIYSRLREKLL